MNIASQPSLTLYYSRRSCSLACHIVLRETGLKFDLVEVKIKKGEQKKPEYLKINPLGKIPSLVIDSEVLTETHAILTFLGDFKKIPSLIPPSGTTGRVRAHEWMNFLSSTVHVTFRTIFRPYNLIGEDIPLGPVRDFARANLVGVMSEIERRLSKKSYALGDKYSVCDAYLFVFYLWCQDERLEMKSPAGPAFRKLAEKVWERPGTRAAVQHEQIASPF